MDCEVTENKLTGRIERLTMVAESFQEQRILRLLVDGMLDERIQFRAGVEGEPAHRFSFGKGKKSSK